MRPSMGGGCGDKAWGDNGGGRGDKVWGDKGWGGKYLMGERPENCNNWKSRLLFPYDYLKNSPYFCLHNEFNWHYVCNKFKLQIHYLQPYRV